MPTRVTTMLVMAASLLVGGHALAQPAQTQIPDFQFEQVLRARELNAIVRQLNLNTSALIRESGTTYPVGLFLGNDRRGHGSGTARRHDHDYRHVQ